MVRFSGSNTICNDEMTLRTHTHIHAHGRARDTKKGLRATTVDAKPRHWPVEKNSIRCANNSGTEGKKYRTLLSWPWDCLSRTLVTSGGGGATYAKHGRISGTHETDGQGAARSRRAVKQTSRDARDSDDGERERDKGNVETQKREKQTKQQNVGARIVPIAIIILL